MERFCFTIFIKCLSRPNTGKDDDDDDDDDDNDNGLLKQCRSQASELEMSHSMLRQ
jgi:hypothetical protein